MPVDALNTGKINVVVLQILIFNLCFFSLRLRESASYVRQQDEEGDPHGCMGWRSDRQMGVETRPAFLGLSSPVPSPLLSDLNRTCC